MGQVTSRITNLFSDKPQNESGEQKNETRSSRLSNYRKSCTNDDSKTSNGSFSFFSLSGLATPRLPLKRSRSFDRFSISVPESIKEIFSPTKRRKIADEVVLDYPFLQDNKTISYYETSKILVILRGLPGSGKSYLAEAIEKKYNSSTEDQIVEICSADDFFMKDGTYTHDFKLLGEAHEQCQKKALTAAQEQVPVIVIHNTNVQLWEMDVYLNIAKTFGYISVVIEPSTPWKRDIEVLQEKNVHSLDKRILERKEMVLEELRPLYFGWFLSDKDSDHLLKNAWSFVETVWSSQESFREDFMKNTGVTSFEELKDFFKKAGKEWTLHCTAKYIGRTLSSENEEYIEETEKFVGKVYDMNIVGFVLTPRTLGARVQLSDSQLDLWGMDDEEPVPSDFYNIDASPEVEEEEQENGNAEEHELEAMNDKSNKGDENSVDQSTNGLNINNESGLNGHADDTNGSILNGSVEDHDSSVNVNGNASANGSLNLPETPKKVSSIKKTRKELLNGGNVDEGMEVECSSEKRLRTPPSSPSRAKKSNKKKAIDIPPNETPVEESASALSLLPVPFGKREDRYTPTSGEGSRAHFTLGCGPTVHAVTTGLDLLMAIGNEKSSSQSDQNQQIFTFGNFSVRKFGNGVWVFYPNTKFRYSSVFTAWN